MLTASNPLPLAGVGGGADGGAEEQPTKETEMLPLPKEKQNKKYQGKGAVQKREKS